MSFKTIYSVHIFAVKVQLNDIWKSIKNMRIMHCIFQYWQGWFFMKILISLMPKVNKLLNFTKIRNISCDFYRISIVYLSIIGSWKAKWNPSDLFMLRKYSIQMFYDFKKESIELAENVYAGNIWMLEMITFFNAKSFQYRLSHFGTILQGNYVKLSMIVYKYEH